MTKTSLALTVAIAAFITALYLGGGQEKSASPNYKVLAPTTQDNLTVFPVVGGAAPDTSLFLTLDEGLKTGQVVVEEQGGGRAMVRPRTQRSPGRGPLFENRPADAQVNRLLLTNKSGKPLLLLAGEIVTGGKQDRVIAKDRLVSANSEPIDLGVFCVEPHRWTQTTAHFDAMSFSMAQPTVRRKAMAAKDQQAVWNAVAKSRASVSGAVPAPVARELAATSSYAATMETGGVQKVVDAVAKPMELAYDKLAGNLRAQGALGAVVAVNGEVVWADVFASPALLQKYWPKLVRSYATEAVSSRGGTWNRQRSPTVAEAQSFLDQLGARRENVESEPGLYRHTELFGEGFHAFVLTSLLPRAPYDLHTSKMKEGEGWEERTIYPR